VKNTIATIGQPQQKHFDITAGCRLTVVIAILVYPGEDHAVSFDSFLSSLAYSSNTSGDAQMTNDSLIKWVCGQVNTSWLVMSLNNTTCS